MHVPIGIKEMQRKSEVVHVLTGFSFGKVYIKYLITGLLL